MGPDVDERLMRKSGLQPSGSKLSRLVDDVSAVGATTSISGMRKYWKLEAIKRALNYYASFLWYSWDGRNYLFTTGPVYTTYKRQGNLKHNSYRLASLLQLVSRMAHFKKAVLRVKETIPAKDGGSSSPRGSFSLEGADPELCITLMDRGLNFRGLMHRLKTADQQWMEQFLALGGLTAIFDALEALARLGFSSIADALKQLECVACVKAVMNNKFGLEFIIAQPGEGFVRKLAEGAWSRSTQLCKLG